MLVHVAIPGSSFGFIAEQDAASIVEPSSKEVDLSAVDGMLATIREVRAENRHRLDRLSCNFGLVRWNAATLEAATTKPPAAVHGQAMCEWRKDGENQVIIVDADPLKNPETIVDSGQGFRYGFRAYSSNSQLLNGMLWLAVESGAGTIHLSGGESPQCLTPWTITATPFDSGRPQEQQVQMTAPSKPGTLGLRLVGERDSSAEFEFDMNRGGLLLHAVYRNKDGDLQVDVVDSQMTDCGGWFPTHLRRIISSASTPNEFVVDECKVTKVLCKLPSGEPDLKLAFEAGTSINAPTLGNMAMTKLEDARLIGPEHLVGLVEECQETEARVRATGFSGFESVQPSPQNATGWKPGLIGAGVGAAIFFGLRFRPKRRALSPSENSR